jgi:hypothetical protein
MEIVSSADFTISYDGEAVRAGLMDVQELGPALLAAGTLLRKANRVLNGDTTSVELKVQSNFERGSFDIHLLINQGLLEQAKNLLLQHPGIKDAKEILEIIFFYVGIPFGLFKVLKELRGKKPDAVKIEEGRDLVVIVIDDRQIETDKNTYALYSDAEVRRAADKLIARPLQTEGIEKVEVRRGNEVATVTKEEAPSFGFSDLEGDLLLDNVSEAWLSIISLSFNPDHKWRFSTGGSTFSANITDDEFWDRVHRHIIRFSEGDQLLVELRTTTARDEKGILRTRYTVERVLQHISTPKQRRLLE